MKERYMRFGEFIKAKRLADSRELTQKDVAEALSVNRSTASLKLNGHRPLYLEDAEKLCDLLRISASEFSAYFFNHEIA